MDGVARLTEFILNSVEGIIPSLAEGNPQASRCRAKEQFASGKGMFLASAPTLQLLFARGRGFSTGMSFVPDENDGIVSLCVCGAFTMRVVVDALGKVVSKADIVRTVDAEEHVGTPTRRKDRRSALRLASLAQGKILLRKKDEEKTPSTRYARSGENTPSEKR